MERKDINRKIFKAYDIRGTYPGEWCAEDAYQIVRAYITIAKCKTIVISHDMRESGEEIAEALIKGALDQGCDVYNVGLASTPMNYFAVKELGADGGVQVTASHNPAGYNGMKITMKGAVPAVGIIDNDELWETACTSNFATVTKQGKILEIGFDIVDKYCDAILDAANIHSLGNLKLAIDCGNGMSGYYLPKMFEKLGNNPIRLYWRQDGTFPNHEANPLKLETLRVLQDTVVDNGCDLGIAYDGDSDRVGFVDEKGEIIPGDFATAIIAKAILAENPGKNIMYDLRASWVIKEEIEKSGGKATMCRVGHAPIKQQMRAEDGFFAGELTGHFYFSQFFVTDNGDMAMFNVLKQLLQTGKKASELQAPLKRYFKINEINSKVEDAAAVLKKVEEIYGPQAKNTFHLDGFSAEFEDWWLNVRMSNTEPLVRLNLEAKTKALMEEKTEEVLKVIRR
ncbi:MAG: phosphomannomutase/phosphoglucomutase [Abditibacteriota bacterium]|nr:phosphomannomutase/phosphoglucomutase [Abditibacteriota bacterium]